MQRSVKGTFIFVPPHFTAYLQTPLILSSVNKSSADLTSNSVQWSPYLSWESNFLDSNDESL
ncbi:hypothetical protein PGTUg99_016604 [Puccinia graminis f. sp. tritici]|uniref:Uncharacterized protein n=1 Tax=Puccinia graminis f. sp. tritici TaxID=56615 RepID=A0A5B0Q497_PUCGR|nr:hypothetical protein PGTUg99_016604 [Puccinia graminis f. sp. tritici]